MDIEAELAALITRVGALERAAFAPFADHGGSTVTTEAERQRDLYADLLAKLPHGGAQEAAELGSKFRVDLRHPDLALLSPEAMSLRAGGGVPSILYGIAHDDVIQWHGGLLREFAGGDGGQGMFATHAQAVEWPFKVTSDVVIGPG